MDNLTKKNLDGPFVDERGTSTGPWPRFLVMTSTDGGKTLSKLSPFAIYKGVKGIAGGEVTIKRQFSGDIYLTCIKKSQSDNLLKCVLFGGIVPVAVTPHKSLNSSKGVVRNWELARTDPDEIKENVPMITDVHRIVLNNVEIKTNTLILTFNTPQIPDYLKICYLNIPVTQYVPNPIIGVISIRGLAMSLADVSTARLVLDAQRLDTRTTHAPMDINVLTMEINMHHTSYYKRDFDIQHIRVSQKNYFRSSYNLSKNSWTEGDEFFWGHQGSNPVYISMYTDRCVVGWGSA